MAGEEDKGLRGEIFYVEPGFGGEGVGFGKDGDEALFEEGVDLDAVGGVAVAEEGDVDGAVKEGGELRGGDEFAEAELDLGVALAEALDGYGQIGEHDGAAKADGEGAFFAATEAANLGEVVADFVEGGAGAGGEERAGGGEADSAGGADEEWVAEELLELFDLLAEGWLGDAELFGGPGEVEGVGYGEEVAKVAEFDLFIHILMV